MSSPQPMHSLWPKEHGAWMQLLFPLASVLWIGRPTGAALALAVAFFAAFLAHEPVLVLAKRRGMRRLDELGPGAKRRVAGLGVLSFAAAAIGLWDASGAVWLSAGAAVLLGAIAMLLAVRGWERNVGGEVHAAVSLVAISVPVGLAAELPLEATLLLVGAWMISMLLGTVTARGVLIRKKDGGRLLTIGALLALAVGAAVAGGAWRGWIDPWLTVGPAAFALASLVLAGWPPSPKRMTAVGFGLVGASTVALVTFGVAFG